MRALRCARTGALLFALACAGCASQAVEETKAPNAPASKEASGAAKPQAPTRPAVREPVAKEPVPAPAEPAPSKGEQLLAQAIKSYEDGDYRSASKQFDAALHERIAAGEQASAHKYLAFIACVSNRPATCRGEFRKAFAADASFDLAPSEAGHPVWGAAFRRVKAEVAAKAKDKAKRP